jgi:putative aminopeptidase FrvX
MRDESLKFLEKLLNTPSPVGHEARGQRVWLDYAGKFADETFSDSYGNVVAVFNKGGSPRLMLAGHADEIAMVVNYINGDGFIYVKKLGGVDPAITKAQRVTIHTRKGPVRGVVGNVAPHLTKADGKDRKAPEIHDLFIDIGVSSKKEAQGIVRIGDPITLVDEFEMLRGDIAISRAFDNRIGTFAVAETLRLLK